MSERKPRIYLDTCIISGMAEMDLQPREIESTQTLLEEYDRGEIEIVTSEVARQEINDIPKQFRVNHEEAYRLLSKVPVAPRKRGTLSLLGLTGRRREDPLYKPLKDLLPDSTDAEHIFQAYRNRCQYFATVDEKTILRFRSEIRECSGVTVGTPSELLKVIHGQQWAPDVE